MLPQESYLNTPNILDMQIPDQIIGHNPIGVKATGPTYIWRAKLRLNPELEIISIQKRFNSVY